MRRFLAVAGLTLLLLAMGAAPASAHVELRATEPPAGAALDDAPAQVVVRFTEPVELSFGSVRVFTADGRRVDRGGASHPGGRRDAVAVAVDADERRGSFVVAWRVLSADSHPVQGAFTFRVGDAGGVGGGGGGGGTDAFVRRLLADQGGSAMLGAVYGVARFGVLGGLLVLVGGAAFVARLWPSGADDRRARRLLAGAWVVAFAATVAAIGLQGAYAAGLGLVDAVRPSVVSSVLETRYGAVAVARLGLLMVGAAVLLRRRGRGTVLGTAVATAVGAALLVTPGLAGHPGTGAGAGFATAVDAVHLAAAAVWVGGLVMLVAAVLPRGDDAAVAARFSSVAFVAVVVLVGTGMLQSLRQVGSLDAVQHTTYGNLLAAKVGLFLAMVGLAASSRRWLRRHAVASLRRSVGAEAVVAVGVVALTALLVNVVPGRNALARPLATTIEAGDLLVEVTIDPAKAGPVDVHAYVIDPRGAVADVHELAGRLSLPAESIGPLRVPLERVAPGHFAAYRFDLPLAGRWRLDVAVRTGPLDRVQGSTEVRIR